MISVGLLSAKAGDGLEQRAISKMIHGMALKPLKESGFTVGVSFLLN
jgi:hypothetical protein